MFGSFVPNLGQVYVLLVLALLHLASGIQVVGEVQENVASSIINSILLTHLSCLPHATSKKMYNTHYNIYT